MIKKKKTTALFEVMASQGEKQMQVPSWFKRNRAPAAAPARPATRLKLPPGLAPEPQEEPEGDLELVHTICDVEDLPPPPEVEVQPTIIRQIKPRPVPVPQIEPAPRPLPPPQPMVAPKPEPAQPPRPIMTTIAPPPPPAPVIEEPASEETLVEAPVVEPPTAKPAAARKPQVIDPEVFLSPALPAQKMPAAQVSATMTAPVKTTIVPPVVTPAAQARASVAAAAARQATASLPAPAVQPAPAIIPEPAPARVAAPPPADDEEPVAPRKQSLTEPRIAIVGARLRMSLGLPVCVAALLGLIVLLYGSYKLGQHPFAKLAANMPPASAASPNPLPAAPAADGFDYASEQVKGQKRFLKEKYYILVEQGVANQDDAQAIFKYLWSCGYVPVVLQDANKKLFVGAWPTAANANVTELKKHAESIRDLGKTRGWTLSGKYSFSDAQPAPR